MLLPSEDLPQVAMAMLAGVRGGLEWYLLGCGQGVLPLQVHLDEGPVGLVDRADVGQHAQRHNPVHAELHPTVLRLETYQAGKVDVLTHKHCLFRRR